MADLSKLRRRPSSLGAPPPLEEASPNLAAPETAPIAPTVPVPELESAPRPAPVSRPSPEPRAAGAPATTRAEPPPPAAGAGEGTRRDGRSARRTGRTLQFATRVSPEFDERVRAIAEADGILLVEVLERALDALEAQRARR